MNILGSDEILTSVAMDDFSRKTLTRMGRLFDLADNAKIEKKFVMLANDIIKDAHKFWKRRSPRDTGELEQSIDVKYATYLDKSTFDLDAYVFIPNSARRGRAYRSITNYQSKQFIKTGAGEYSPNASNAHIARLITGAQYQGRKQPAYGRSATDWLERGRKDFSQYVKSFEDYR